MKLKLSARDEQVSDIKYDDENFSAESRLNFSTEFNVSNLAMTLWDLGYHDEASISKQLKERNITMDAKAKEIVKAVVDKMESKTETASWKSYLK